MVPHFTIIIVPRLRALVVYFSLYQLCEDYCRGTHGMPIYGLQYGKGVYRGNKRATRNLGTEVHLWGSRVLGLERFTSRDACSL